MVFLMQLAVKIGCLSVQLFIRLNGIIKESMGSLIEGKVTKII